MVSLAKLNCNFSLAKTFAAISCKVPCVESKRITVQTVGGGKIMNETAA